MTRTAVAPPRRVFCVIEHLHRDRGIADDACAGRFTNAGLALDRGPVPSWRDDLPPDEEWTIEWSKCYFGLDLAYAYRCTGDGRYLAAWQRLVTSWMDQLPADHDSSDVTARRLQNWIYAWTGFARRHDFPGLGAAFAARLSDSLAAQASHVRRNLTPERNHRTLELYGLIVYALAFPTVAEDGLLGFAVDEMGNNLLADVTPDGVHRECSTHYHMIALRSFLGLREQALRFGFALPDGYEKRLAAALRFAMHVQLPEGGIPPLSDSDDGDHGRLLVRAARLLRRPDLLWVGTRGRVGRPPAETSPGFPDGGYVVQRSGWGTDAATYAKQRFLIMDCGPLGAGGHGHYDQLSVVASAGGRPLLVDPGRYTYSEDAPNWRRWFKGTAAHNTVVVDGKDQTPYRRGKPKGGHAVCRVRRRWSSSRLDLAEGEVVSPCYEAVHRRQVVFVDRRFWVVVDHLSSPTEHEYDLRFHLAPEAAGSLELGSANGCAVARAPGLRLVSWPCPDWRLERGWVSRRYGCRSEAPVVAARRRGRDVTFVTLIWPHADVPELSVASEGQATLVRVRSDRGDEHVIVRDAAGRVPELDARAALAWWRGAMRWWTADGERWSC